MKMKRFLTLLLAVMLIIALFAGCAKSPVANGDYIAGGVEDVGADLFDRGLCLPSDNKMTVEEQNKVIEIVRSCFE